MNIDNIEIEEIEENIDDLFQNQSTSTGMHLLYNKGFFFKNYFKHQELLQIIFNISFVFF